MTITIPVWLVIVLACLFLINSFHRTRQVVKGVKAVWPVVKDFLDPKKEATIKIEKKIEKV